MNWLKTTSLFITFLFVSIWMSSCSENPFVGTWTGSQGGYNYTVKIKKDKTFSVIQDYSRNNRVYLFEGTWKEFNDETIELSYSSMTVSSSKNGMWQLDSNAKEYPVDSGTLYLRKDGSFGDAMSTVSQDSFFLTKEHK